MQSFQLICKAQLLLTPRIRTLFATDNVIDALKTGKLGYLWIDVYEERKIYLSKIYQNLFLRMMYLNDKLVFTMCGLLHIKVFHT